MKTRSLPDWVHTLPALFGFLIAFSFAAGWLEPAAAWIGQTFLGGQRHGGAGGSAAEQRSDGETHGRELLLPRGVLATPTDRGGTRQRRRGGAGRRSNSHPGAGSMVRAEIARLLRGVPRDAATVEHETETAPISIGGAR